MTSLRNMGTPSNRMNQHANLIYAAITAAERDGFKLILKHGWAVDMVDENGNSTPVIGLFSKGEGY